MYIVVGDGDHRIGEVVLRIHDVHRDVLPRVSVLDEVFGAEELRPDLLRPRVEVIGASRLPAWAFRSRENPEALGLVLRKKGVRGAVGVA